MNSDLTFWIFFGDFQKVLSETHFNLTFGLPNILNATSFAGDAVYQVGTTAVHIEMAHLGPTGCGTKDPAIRVELWAISTTIRIYHVLHNRKDRVPQTLHIFL